MSSRFRISSEQVYSWDSATRRYHADGQAIGILRRPREHEWEVRFTRPQPSGIPWTEFHTPAILSEYSFVAGDVATADAHAQDWLAGQYLRHVAGDAIANVVEDYFTFSAAVRRSADLDL